MSSVISSYLDKSISPEKRVEELWFVAFFLRAYMCIQINAHSLLAFLLNTQLDEMISFVPWMMFGSQSCERTFRSLRSMTSTFSMIINFNILVLLQGLHYLFRRNVRRNVSRPSQVYGCKKKMVVAGTFTVLLK